MGKKKKEAYVLVYKITEGEVTRTCPAYPNSEKQLLDLVNSLKEQYGDNLLIEAAFIQGEKIEFEEKETVTKYKIKGR